ncbi:hypothetical protein J3458_012320 [Metarhizium acridum]|uniref:uncharacterized protein n=1 Tax=Metarhizium acridum TaxID=92637 RepID=UPI001C6AB602|nr:hypothetical protein J3458_012320 [Metarhizium acridum]
MAAVPIQMINVVSGNALGCLVLISNALLALRGALRQPLELLTLAGYNLTLRSTQHGHRLLIHLWLAGSDKPVPSSRLVRQLQASALRVSIVRGYRDDSICQPRRAA